ncbi:hypothetical protein [Roseobacter sp. AzwK-3b]|uniref:hypothetical protein n=1 Tax=Roseobacter sp. AzwK-3b TaxID=351016 RepID=UPI0012F4A514|nr:hypothetical protein [Roseobacter sp. AzwK-3b]
MQHISEVCDLLAIEGERRYEETRNVWQSLAGEFEDNASLTVDEANQLEAARKEHHRAAKEYLAIAFKAKFLEI